MQKEVEKNLAVYQAKTTAEKERDSLSSKLETIQAHNDVAKKLAITQAVNQSQKECDELKRDIEKAYFDDIDNN